MYCSAVYKLIVFTVSNFSAQCFFVSLQPEICTCTFSFMCVHDSSFSTAYNMGASFMNFIFFWRPASCISMMDFVMMCLFLAK